MLGRVCVSWYIELFAGGGKAAPSENGNRDAIVWKFQLFHGPRPFRFGSWSVWCRHLLWRVCVSWYIELFGRRGKSPPVENGNWNPTVWKFHLPQAPRPFRFGSRSVWCRDLLGRVCVSWRCVLGAHVHLPQKVSRGPAVRYGSENGGVATSIRNFRGSWGGLVLPFRRPRLLWFRVVSAPACGVVR